MLKHRAGWGRWLAGIAVVMLAPVVAWVLFVPAADWLAHRDVGSARGPLLQTARDDARGRLLTLGAGLFAAGALVFTARNFTLSRRTFELTEQGQVTDRYTKAIEQLGSEKLDVRIGGIYALERVASDSARDHPTVMEVLTAFIREHSHEQWPPPHHPASREQERSARPDVQAAITVVRCRDTERDIRPIDLHGATLARADLNYADLTGATLNYATLAGADLARADLSGATLARATLADADLAGATLTRATLNGATLIDANLIDANLGRADLNYANLTGANLANVTWPGNTPVPPRWERDPGTGWLRRLAVAPPERLEVAPYGEPPDGPKWPRLERQREGAADQSRGQIKPTSESGRPGWGGVGADSNRADWGHSEPS